MIPERLIGRLKSARSVTVFTGVGVSAESGVPTFRDAQTGYWAKYRRGGSCDASRMGATVVEVNPTMTDFTQQAHFHLGGPSGEVVPLIIEALKSANSG